MADIVHVSADWQPKIERMLEENVIGVGLTNISGNLERRKPSRALVAENDGVLIGYLDGHLYRLPDAIVWNVFVHPNRQRLGVGARLMETFEKWARKSNALRIRLESAHVLLGAHAFYLQKNYQLLGTHRLDGELTDVTMLDFVKNL